MIGAAYLIVGLSLGVLGLRVTGIRHVRDVLKPYTLFHIFFVYMYLLIPAFQVWNGAHWHQLVYRDSTLLLNLLALLVFWSVVTIGYSLTRPKLPVRRFKVQSLGAAHVFLLGIILLPIAFFALTEHIQTITTVGFSAYLSYRIVLGAGQGYLNAVLGWFLPFALFIATNQFLRQANNPHRRINWLSIIFFLALAVTSGLLQGSRTRALLPLVFVTIAWLYTLHAKKRVVSIKALVVVSIAICVLLSSVYLREVRTQAMVSGQLNSGAGEAHSSADNRILDLLKAFPEYENMWWLIEHRSNWDPLNGATFAAAVTGFVPRSIWQDKPLGGGPHLVNMIKPGSYDLNSRTGITSYTTGLVAEAFLNFGWWGIPIVASVYAMVIMFVERLMHKVRTTTGIVVTLILAIRVVLYLRGEFFGDTARIAVEVLPLLMFALVTQLLSRYRSTVLLATSGGNS